MNTKKDTQFSFEDCSCTEMMSLMMTQFEGLQRIGDGCAEMVSLFADSQGGSSEFFEMMSQMIASCCDTHQESDKSIREA